MSNMRKAAIYARVSTDNQDYERQVSEIENYCNINNIEITHRFTEKISGFYDLRPEFTKMSVLERSDIDVIIVHELSRLGRKVSTIVKTVEDFAQKQISIISLKENFISLDESGVMTSSALMMLGFMATMAQIERNTIKERTLSGRRHKVLNGDTASYTSKIPFGYKKEGHKIVIDEPNAELVKTIYDMYINGSKLNDIANILHIARNTIHYILKNEVYTGMKYSGLTESYIEIPKLISKEDYNKVQIIMKNNIIISKKSLNNHPLKGKLFCGVCGYMMSKHGGEKNPTWQCQCGCNTMKFKVAEKATETAIEATKNVLGYNSAKEAIESHIKQLYKQASDLSEIVDNLYDKVEEEKKKLEVLKDVFTADKLKKEIGSLKRLENERDKQEKILQNIFIEIKRNKKSLEEEVIDESVIQRIDVYKTTNTTKVMKYTINDNTVDILVDYSNKKNIKIEEI